MTSGMMSWAPGERTRLTVPVPPPSLEEEGERAETRAGRVDRQPLSLQERDDVRDDELGTRREDETHRPRASAELGRGGRACRDACRTRRSPAPEPSGTR